MPLYEYECETCYKQLSLIQPINADNPTCCNQQMRKKITFPAMVKIKAEGGYPSRRKFVKGTAPYTTRSTKAWLDEDPHDDKIKYMGERKRQI